jgi:hypothetical protein
MIVYEVVDASGTCIYVGSSKGNLAARRAVHRCFSEMFPGRPLYKYMAEKGGWEAFKFSVISEHPDADRQEVFDREAAEITARKPLCNKIQPYTGLTKPEYAQIWGSEKVTCACGASFRRDSLHRHVKSGRHQKASLLLKLIPLVTE